MLGYSSQMFPRVMQRPTQDLDSCSDEGNDTSQNRQEAHQEAIGIASTKQPDGCQADYQHDSSHTEPERDTLESQAPRSSFPQWYPSIAWDWSAIQQLADGY